MDAAADLIQCGRAQFHHVKGVQDGRGVIGQLGAYRVRDAGDGLSMCDRSAGSAPAHSRVQLFVGQL